MPTRPPRAHLVAWSTVLAAVALTTVGCSGTDTPASAPGSGGPTSSGTSASGTAPPSSPGSTLPTVPSTGTGAPSAIAAAYCERLLPTRAVATLAEHPVGAPVVEPVGGIPGCTWSATDGSPTTVQVVNTSSSTWGAGLPALQQALVSQGAELGAQTLDDLATAAEQAASGAEVDADLACEIFAELAVDTGFDDGVTAISRVQSQGGRSQVVVEACSGDEYSSLQLTVADLGADPAATTRRAEAALQRAHGGPLQFPTSS